jgi:hypothetical protein
MAFLNNTKFKEIREAAKNGNEKAAMVLQALIKGNQSDVERLVDAYYKVEETPIIEEEIKETTPVEIPKMPEENSVEPQIEDISGILDKDLDGIISQEEIKELSFGDFLNNKKNDGIKLTRNADYFKAYTPEGRQAYLDKKIGDYKNSFNSKLKSIDRQYKDLDNSLGKYSQSVNDMLDDDIELDMSKASDVYGKITNDNDTMLGLGRGHDEEDFQAIVGKLQELISEYGKKNVMAALNTLRSDNSGYRDFRNNQINQEVERYSKNLEKLLK